ncbi:MAG: hypothetical protein H6715_06455 [Myxococcales bacterium]|nr:hypothetical protein [Myxococcales bacterium]MCB9709216.1 hypothetical protein [Myxococcales bacterium]
MATLHTRNARDHAVGFCPFCGELVEGRPDCPVHELKLVPFEKLTGMASDRSTPLSQLLCGLGILGWTVGMLLDFVTVEMERPVVLSAFELAKSRAYNLWTVPLSAAVMAVILLRRRSAEALHRAGLAMIVTSMMPLVSLGYTYLGVMRWSWSQPGSADVSLGPGIYLICAASAVAAWGAGRLSRRGRPPSAFGKTPVRESA